MANGEKYLRVTMPDGSKWDVPARTIARNRAQYYARKVKTPAAMARVYSEEFDATYDDDRELMDWAGSNMNWEDVSAQAVLANPARPDFQEGWVNGDKEIVVKP